MDIQPTGFPGGLDVRCENKRDQGGLKVLGMSNCRVGQVCGEISDFTLARVILKCLLDKPPVKLSVSWK